jgi:hypothetical protein
LFFPSIIITLAYQNIFLTNEPKFKWLFSCNTPMIDNNRWEKQAKNEVETLVRWISPHLQKVATSTQQDTSQVLAQAHESLYNNHIALSASPVLPQHPPSIQVAVFMQYTYDTLFHRNNCKHLFIPSCSISVRFVKS